MSRQLGYERAYLDRTHLASDAPLVFTASSTTVNRYGFALNQQRWQLDNFARNGVVLWAHDATIPPIGRADATPAGNHLRAEITFDLDDDLARKIDRKYRIGHLSAVSVGFDFVNEDGSPIDDPWRLSPERIQGECWYDLAEISAVPVPADPKALRQNHQLSLLGSKFVALLDEYEDGDGPLEQIRAAVRTELAALGIDLAALAKPADPPSTPESPAPEPAAGIERDAAAAVLAAFNLEGVTSE